jgi:hypothetical protein
MFLWIHFNSLHTKFRNFRWFNQTKNLSAQRNELKYREVICQSLIHQFKYQQIQMYLSFCQFTKYTVSSLEIFLHLSRFEWQTMVDCSVSGLIYYQIVFNYNIRCALRFLVWLNQRKLRKLVCNELKWIHRNILQNWHRDGTVCSHVGADDLLKNMPSDLDKYDIVGNNRHL